jgi:hypothetical protein
MFTASLLPFIAAHITAVRPSRFRLPETPMELS